MSGTWQDFEGDDNLTGFEKVVATILLRNELGGVASGYELSHAVIGKSGYSFGGNQMDLYHNSYARTVLNPLHRVCARYKRAWRRTSGRFEPFGEHAKIQNWQLCDLFEFYGAPGRIDCSAP